MDHPDAMVGYDGSEQKNGERRLSAMARFRCPECGTETQPEARFGGEIVSVYCLRHAGGADVHLRPVYRRAVMEPVTELVEAEWAEVAA
jgi:hypothetical protein